MKIPRSERSHEVGLMPTDFSMRSPRFLVLWLVGERLLWETMFRILIDSFLGPW
jgi:hypothetical protein